jgi:hypothetical protein
MRPRPISQRSGARRLAATGAAVTLVLAVSACNGDDDGADLDPFGDDTTTTQPVDTVPPEETAPDDTQPTEDDVTPEVTLETAIQSTLDQGSADYTIWVSHDSLEQIAGDRDNGMGDDGTGDDDDNGLLDDGTGDDGQRDDQREVSGRAQFDEFQRQVTVEANDDERQVIIDNQVMYIELRDDDVTDGTTDDATGDDATGDAEWGRVMLDELDAGGVAMTPDLLIALHDPIAVLRAVGPAQTGTAGMDDAGTTAQPDTDGRHQMVRVPIADIQDPFVQMLGEQTGRDDLEVHVWFDDDGDNGIIGDNGDGTDARVHRIAYDLAMAASPTSPGGTGVDPGTGAPGTEPDDDLGTTDDGLGGTGTDDGTGTTGTDDNGTVFGDPQDPETTDPGATGQDGTAPGVGDDATMATGPFVVVEFDSFGDIDDIDVPEQDEVRDVEFARISALLGVDLLTDGRATGTGATGTGTGTDDGTGTGTGTGTETTTTTTDTDN